MRNITDFIKDYDNAITEDLDLILESELIEEGFFGKLKAAWGGLKDSIKASPSWKAYQEKQQRYAEVDKEVEDKYKGLKDKSDKDKETIEKINKNQEVKPEEKKAANADRLEAALETISAFERFEKASQDYKEYLELAKSYGFKNLKDCKNFVAKANEKGEIKDNNKK